MSSGRGEGRTPAPLELDLVGGGEGTPRLVEQGQEVLDVATERRTDLGLAQEDGESFAGLGGVHGGSAVHHATGPEPCRGKKPRGGKHKSKVLPARGRLPVLPSSRELGIARPRTRADCESGPRPCPWVSCSHHLLLDVRDNGSLVLLHGHDDPAELADTCALDVADRGEHTLEEVARHFSWSRERARQVQERAQQRARVGLELEGITDARDVASPEGLELGRGGAGDGLEDGEVYEPPGAAKPATRAPFLPDSHHALVDALARRADPDEPHPPGDEEVERLRELARRDALEDADGWASRVWDAYVRFSARDGHGDGRYDKIGRRRGDAAPQLGTLSYGAGYSPRETKGDDDEQG